ncbi:hypothetical protein [Bifidobacterium pullorum]|nr:hypothetical protein [Bifidobacterium pullorum]
MGITEDDRYKSISAEPTDLFFLSKIEARVIRLYQFRRKAEH